MFEKKGLSPPFESRLLAGPLGKVEFSHGAQGPVGNSQVITLQSDSSLLSAEWLSD